MLEELGFEEPPARIHLYNRSLKIWLIVKPGHIVTVTENNHVFIKSLAVKSPLAFDTHLAAASSTLSTQNTQLNLAHQRAVVRAKIRNHSQSTRSASVESLSSQLHHLCHHPSAIPLQWCLSLPLWLVLLVLTSASCRPVLQILPRSLASTAVPVNFRSRLRW